jgi:hypothetical protein
VVWLLSFLRVTGGETRRLANLVGAPERVEDRGLRQNGAMWTDELQVSSDVSAAAWIAPRLGGQFGAVTRAVPSGYPAYVRVCHPAADSDGKPVSWADVAEATGRRSHALMQWHRLVGLRSPDDRSPSLWQGGEPTTGELSPDVLAPLCDLLGTHTAERAHCFFCLWEGWGWVDGSGSEIVVALRDGAVTSDPREEPVRPAFSSQELGRGRVRLPGRDYLLLEGPVSAATKIGHWAVPGWFLPQSPNLFWPADRAWCAASEIDFDSTLIGGSTELIEAILDSPRFDAWVVSPEDSLASDADKINVSDADH